MNDEDRMRSLLQAFSLAASATRSALLERLDLKTCAWHLPACFC